MKASTALAIPADRLAQVYTWILEGASEHDITEAAHAKWPDTAAKPLIVAPMQRIAAAGESDAGTIKGWCLEATRHVYQRAMEAGDLATALRAIKQVQSIAV